MVVALLTTLTLTGCGNRSMASLESSATFIPIGDVDLTDHGQWCATFSVGTASIFDDCIEADHLPTVVSVDFRLNLMLLAVDSGHVVSFADAAVQVLESTDSWVAAQFVADIPFRGAPFTVTSPSGVDICVVNRRFEATCLD